MKNGKADSKPMMGGRDRANNMSSPMMGTRAMSKNGKAQSSPMTGTSDGYDHSVDIKDAEGLPMGGRKVGKVSPVMDAKAPQGSKQTDTARAMWHEGIESGHDEKGDAAMPMKYTGHESYHKENPGVQTKARADHFRRIGGGANEHGDNPVSKQHNNTKK